MPINPTNLIPIPTIPPTLGNQNFPQDLNNLANHVPPIFHLIITLPHQITDQDHTMGIPHSMLLPPHILHAKSVRKAVTEI